MSESNRKRTAFTIPELLVAAAVSLGLMLIIAVAFQRALDAFRTLRAVGKLQDQLRSVANVIHRDLAAQHFDGPFQAGLSGPYVRDQRLDLVGWSPPAQGYFEIRQGQPSHSEGTDEDGLHSYVAPGAFNHRMRFTSYLTGRRAEDWFYASLLGTPVDGHGGQAYPDPNTGAPIQIGDVNFSGPHTAASRWAEIAYFLAEPANLQTASGNPLYTLYRQERILFPSADPTWGLQSPSSIVSYANRNGGGAFRLTPYAGTTGNEQQGDDILCTNVLSFQVRCHWSVNYAIHSVSPANAPILKRPAVNDDWPFEDLQLINSTSPSGGIWGHRFDTGSQADAHNVDWSDNTPPTGAPRSQDKVSFLYPRSNAPLYRVRMSSVQIRLRIWDAPTQTTRQMTIVQDI